MLPPSVCVTSRVWLCISLYTPYVCVCLCVYGELFIGYRRGDGELCKGGSCVKRSVCRGRTGSEDEVER